jgi:DNA invertase Pin-like site-specific DNA recombinase
MGYNDIERIRETGCREKVAMARPRGSRKQRVRQARLATGAGRLIGYIRVSTADQSERGHSLAGQRERLAQVCEREGYELVGVVSDVESGAKERPQFEEAWKRVLEGEAEGIVFPKLDRVGRSQIHLARIVEQAREHGVSLLSADEGWQVRQGELLNEALPFLIALAQVERERISRRTKEGLQAARQKGVALGRPAEVTGKLADRAVRLRRKGSTVQRIADLFNREGLRTPRGAAFRAMTVYRMIERTDPSANPEGGYPGNVVAAT